MNEDMLKGEGRDIGGKLTETAGDIVGDPKLQAEGLGDQLAGKAQKIVGSIRDSIEKDGAPLLDRARLFAKDRPFAAIAVAGVIAIGLLNTLRGRK